jgi:hypothetical protein
MRRILVQDCRTKLFYRAGKDWTSRPDEARHFPTTVEAVAFCLQQKLPEVQVIMKFDHFTADVVVPVRSDPPR